VLAKGVLSGEDAKEAVQSGVAGMIVSNHGGKGLDGINSSLAALPEIVAAVGSDAEIFLDGGVRNGADVVKAVALGARAVGIGRPLVWGLGAGGEAGVRQVLTIFREGIDRSLGLLGCSSIESLDATYVDAAQL
jgi:isopentenyl diphosphate isomerase/L-lactate dehydrogenase-like FMN-dependent dehydrogenase